MAILLVLFILMTACLGRRSTGPCTWPGRIKATQQLINSLGIALARYQAEFRSLPPDTGYGLPLSTRKVGDVVVYDSGALWRYLGMPLVQRPQDGTTIKTLGPYLTLGRTPPGNIQLLPYDDPIYGKSYYLVDSWGKPIGYVGSPKRVIHNRGFCDLFSAGPDGVTAINNGIAIPGVPDKNTAYDDDGDVSEMGKAILNGALTQARTDPQPGEVLDDINNWDPQQQ